MLCSITSAENVDTLGTQSALLRAHPGHLPLVESESHAPIAAWVTADALLPHPWLAQLPPLCNQHTPGPGSAAITMN